jgi:hypothetical protein
MINQETVTKIEETVGVLCETIQRIAKEGLYPGEGQTLPELVKGTAELVKATKN